LTKADALRHRIGDEAYSSEKTTSFPQSELDRALEREIAAIWQSDEVSRSKPTPENEAKSGTVVVETVLWEALPSFLRKLNATLQSVTSGQKGLPLRAAPIIFSSWMGGDRDGNPNVTSATTTTVCLRQRKQVAGLLKRDIIFLEKELSITKCSDELRAVVGEAPREPYRAMLRPVSKCWMDASLYVIIGTLDTHSPHQIISR
jgi:phosphoenolpyruvate carboxylase